MTTRAHIRAEDLAELLVATASYSNCDPDVSVRCWCALNATDASAARVALERVALDEGIDHANAIVAAVTRALDAAGPDGLPA